LASLEDGVIDDATVEAAAGSDTPSFRVAGHSLASHIQLYLRMLDQVTVACGSVDLNCAAVLRAISGHFGCSSSFLFEVDVRKDVAILRVGPFSGVLQPSSTDGFPTVSIASDVWKHLPKPHPLSGALATTVKSGVLTVASRGKDGRMSVDCLPGVDPFTVTSAVFVPVWFTQHPPSKSVLPPQRLMAGVAVVRGLFFPCLAHLID
jgi:hypothetical protein